MAIQNTFYLDVDIKRDNYVDEPKVTQNDAVTFVLRMTDDGVDYPLTGVSTYTLASLRPDGQSVLTVGTLTVTNEITFELGSTEVSVPGNVKAAIQLYDADGRVSSIPFTYEVSKDIAVDYIPSAEEETLIQLVLGEGPAILNAAELVTAEANTFLANNVRKGEYDNEAAYEKGNEVGYGGSSYVALGITQGNIPTDTAYWALRARKGQGDVNSVNGVFPDGTGDVTITIPDPDLSGLEARSDVVVNVAYFGAKGDGVTDDTAAIISAVDSFLNDSKKNVLHFPGEKYIMSQKLPVITKDVLITGESETGTEIEYRASTDGVFIENSSTWKFQMKNMYLRIIRQSTEVEVGGIELYRGNRSTWGKVAELENVRVEGYTTFGIKIYAPFMSNFKKVHTLGHLELIANPSNPKLPHPDIQCIGFDLVGYEPGVIDTFGNVNTFENCWFSNNKYGVRLVSVANTLFKGCTFEPNFINLYATSPTVNSNSGNIVVDNCWFEDYTGACHPTLGAYITYKFNETTGDLVIPLTELARVTLVNTTVHPSCPIDKRVNGGFLYSDKQVFSYKTFAELDSENVIYKEVGNIDGHYLKFGTKENYIRNLTKFERGQAILASNNVSGYEETSLYYYNITNPNADKSVLYTFEIPIVVSYGSWVELQIDALIVAGGGNPVVCRAYLHSTSVSNSTVLSDPQLLATEIDANNKGLKLTYNNTTGKVTVSIQASVSTKTNLNVKYIKRMAM